MTTIKEGEVLELDLDQFLDLGDDNVLETASTTQAFDPEDLHKPSCPSHPGPDRSVIILRLFDAQANLGSSCLCHGFMGDWEVSLPLQDPSAHIPVAEAGRYDDFANWMYVSLLLTHCHRAYLTHTLPVRGILNLNSPVTTANRDSWNASSS